MKTTTASPLQYKFLILLCMLYVVSITVPSLFLYRLIQIGPLILPGGMFIFPFIYLLNDIITEVYGYKLCRLVIWYSLLANFIFAFFVLSIIYLPTPLIATKAAEYSDLFHNILRGDVANLVGMICGSFLNSYALAKWKILLRGKYFILRSISANVIGEAVMLLLWSMIAFSGELANTTILKLIASDYLVRVIYSFLTAFPAALIVNFLKQHENIDTYDFSTNFNPLKLSLTDNI